MLYSSFALGLFSALALAAPAPLEGEPALEKRVFDSTNADAIAKQAAAVRAATSPDAAYNILGPEGLSFDFLSAPKGFGGGKDGSFVFANDQIFPGVIGQGMSMLMIFMGPCGMVSPHIHPRATEFLLNIAGPPLYSHIIAENGAPPVTTELMPGSVAVLPRGSVHMVASEGCYPSAIVAALNHEDPGVLFFATAYTSLDNESLDAAFGGFGAQVYNATAIPNAVALGRESCLKKCGIDRKTFDISSTSNDELMSQAFVGYLKAKAAGDFGSKKVA